MSESKYDFTEEQGGMSGGKFDFGKLLQDSKLLTSHIDSMGVPPIQRSLAQLESTSRKLSRKHPKGMDPAADSKAQMFFATKGVDMLHHTQTLQNIDLSKAFEPLEPLDKLDMDQFLLHQHQMLINTAIVESTKMTNNTFRRHYISQMEADWEQSKRDLLETMGMRKGLSGASAATASSSSKELLLLHDAPSSSTSGILPPSSSLVTAGGTSQLTYEQEQYAHIIMTLNRHRQLQQPFGLIKVLKDAAEEVENYTHYNGGAATGTSEMGDVIDCWDCIRSIVGEKDVLNGKFQTKVIEEGQFQAGYLNNSKALSRQLVQGSLRYCEGLFADYMEEVVRQNRTQASRGMGGNNGVPSLLNSVRGYLNVTRSQWEWEDMLEQLSRHSQHASAQHPLALTQTSSLQLASAQHTNIAYFEGYPLWPQIFYAFRCGNHRAALELAQLAGEKGGLVSSIFLSCFQQWCQSINDSGSSDLTQGKVIDTNDWTALNQEYNRECRAASGNGVSGVGSGVNTDTLGLDPFKIAMYMIIGRFKVNPAINLLKYIAPTTEDYMWLKLSVVWCFDTPVPDFIATQYTLPKARELSLEYFQEGLIQRGEKHFNADGRSPLRYFKVMLLSLQFEQAIYYLIRTHLFERAVHMMIALDYYGLLRRTLREDQPLLTEAVPSSFASASAASKLAGVGGRGLGFGASAGASQDASVEGGKSYAINLWRIIKKYIQDLTQTNPIECFHYLFLLYIPAHRREVIMKYHYPNAAGGSLSGAGAVGGLSRPLEDNQSMMGLSMASASSSSSSSEIKYMDNEFDQSGLSSSAYNLNSASAGSDGGDSSNIGISEIKCNSLCFKAMSDLILATKEYSLLIGCIRRGRVVKDGCFYHYFPDVIAKLIISNTAHVADENGSFIDAIQLFSLAEKDLQIVLILIAQISRVVSGAINSPTRVEVCNLAKQYLDRKRARGMGARSTSSYSSSSSSSSSRLDSSMLLDSSSASAVNLTSSGSASSASSALASFSGASDAVTQQENEQLQVAEQSLMLLLRLVNYFDLYHLGTPKYNDALVLLDSLQILPWCGDADERGGVIQSDLEMAVARFERLHPSIKRNFPDVVISCMEMYYVKYQQLKDEVSKGGSGAGSMMGGMGGGYGNSRDAARRKLLVDYRVKAKTLINFIGLTALPITADVNFKLVRLEALMS